MRQHKFRGKRVDTGEWVYGCYLKKWTGTKYKHYIHDGLLEYEVDPETVGEFTGLYDCKRTEQYPEGQEIYEGDIVKCKNCADRLGRVKFGKYKQNGMSNKYECGNLGFCIDVGDELIRKDIFFWQLYIEVMSTIHDPELMEVPNE